MGGHIKVESNYPEAGEIEPGQSGSSFTISIPVQVSIIDEHDITHRPLPKIAILHAGNERAVEGLQTAWEIFGFVVVLIKNFDELSGTEWTYIWADLLFLNRNLAFLHSPIGIHHGTPILVPCNSQDTFHQVSKIASAPNCVLLPRPLTLHSISQRVAASQEHKRSEIPRIVRSASTVDIVKSRDTEQAGKSSSRNSLILLVEDNPINQRLGQKMLASLGYEVKIADNAQKAIDVLSNNFPDVDAILMDQSMPHKDGVTATEEIRELEATGTISKRIPIVALTAVVNSHAQALFKAAGADDFLPKPLSLVKLEQTLAALLSTKSKWK